MDDGCSCVSVVVVVGYLSVNATRPGNAFPSSSSNDAPPPGKMKYAAHCSRNIKVNACVIVRVLLIYKSFVVYGY